jgi:hypothetical protein
MARARRGQALKHIRISLAEPLDDPVVAGARRATASIK